MLTILDYFVVMGVESWSSMTSTENQKVLPTTTKSAKYMVYAAYVLAICVLVSTGSILRSIGAWFFGALATIILHRKAYGIPMFYERRE